MIPPRPWRLLTSPEFPGFSACFDANGEPVGFMAPNVETAELIVRLVNAEAQVVEALESAHRCMYQLANDRPRPRYDDHGYPEALHQVGAALALLRNDRPGEGGER